MGCYTGGFEGGQSTFSGFLCAKAIDARLKMWSDPEGSGPGDGASLGFARSIKISGLGLVEGLVEIPEDVVEGFESDRDAHHVRGDAGGYLLFFTELAVRG